MADWLQYNQQFAKAPMRGPDAYQTRLTPDQENLYRKWLTATGKDTGIKYDPDDASYDMRGYWADVVAGGRFKRMGKAQHFPDTYKTPYHPTFSRESKYATDDAPYWTSDDVLRDPLTNEPTPGYIHETNK